MLSCLSSGKESKQKPWRNAAWWLTVTRAFINCRIPSEGIYLIIYLCWLPVFACSELDTQRLGGGTQGSQNGNRLPRFLNLECGKNSSKKENKNRLVLQLQSQLRSLAHWDFSLPTHPEARSAPCSTTRSKWTSTPAIQSGDFSQPWLSLMYVQE